MSKKRRNLPLHAVPLAGKRPPAPRKPKGKQENQAGHSSERTVGGKCAVYVVVLRFTCACVRVLGTGFANLKHWNWEAPEMLWQ